MYGNVYVFVGSSYEGDHRNSEEAGDESGGDVR